MENYQAKSLGWIWKHNQKTSLIFSHSPEIPGSWTYMRLVFWEVWEQAWSGMVRFHIGFSINPMLRLPQGCEEPPSADENRVCTRTAEGLRGKEKGPAQGLLLVLAPFTTQLKCNFWCPRLQAYMRRPGLSPWNQKTPVCTSSSCRKGPWQSLSSLPLFKPLWNMAVSKELCPARGAHWSMLKSYGPVKDWILSKCLKRYNW